MSDERLWEESEAQQDVRGLAVQAIRERDAARARVEKAEARARQACQTLVAAFGSIGPEDVEHAAERAAKAHAKTLARVAELENVLETGTEVVRLAVVRADKAEDRIAELVEALKPFAIEGCDPMCPDSCAYCAAVRALRGGRADSVSDGATRGSPPRQQGVDAGSPGGAEAPSLPGATSPTPASTQDHSRSCNFMAQDLTDENDGECDCATRTGSTER